MSNAHAQSTKPWLVDSSVPVLPSEEEDDLRAAMRDLLGTSDIDEVRRVANTSPGYSRQVWSALTESMSVTTMAVPEPVGLGYGLSELCTVIEECGRALRPEPVVLSAAIGVHALLLGPDEELGNLLAGALDGSRIVTTTSLTARSDELAAECDGGGWRVSGRARSVASGDVADIVVVTAETDTGRMLFAVPSGDRVGRTPLDSLDPTRTITALDLDEAPAIAILHPDLTPDAVATLRDRAAIALAAESVGMTGALVDMTLEYTKARKQFGRQIASYQAIKHRLADLYVDLERARSAARYAATLHDVDPARAGLAAAVAGAVCGDVVVRASTEAIQLHGGIGFTWEHAAHNYYRRALANEALFGDTAAHRRRIAQIVGVHPSAA
ncbi:acyl-CoA dehydrogenase family protein [Gordonia sp. KTR9]|uniref:acyl-CoA dehydrogenase family protein n=1 Tax=Gordonia sp. KTR9 TaxID=337191 RepID=UPI00027DE83F|nr:acyl-CoA dehydrogenase family protein [Gordonia sp. KTR9]AFR51020.1 Acyl-CoA dehydrogenase [Gordonia sp. KTR9]